MIPAITPLYRNFNEMSLRRAPSATLTSYTPQRKMLRLGFIALTLAIVTGFTPRVMRPTRVASASLNMDLP
jgi:hypothetical protein